MTHVLTASFLTQMILCLVHLYFGSFSFILHNHLPIQLCSLNIAQSIGLTTTEQEDVCLCENKHYETLGEKSNKSISAPMSLQETPEACGALKSNIQLLTTSSFLHYMKI